MSEKIFLETSFQRTIVLNKKLRKIILENSELKYSSTMVYYEYRLGFIRVLIDLFYLLELKGDLLDAILVLKNSFRARESKANIEILGQILQKIYKSGVDAKDNDESIIQDLQDRIEELVLEYEELFFTFIRGTLLNDFPKDNPVISFNLKDRSKFSEFKELCKNNKFIDSTKFWGQKGAMDALNILIGIPDSEYESRKLEYIKIGLNEIKLATTKAFKNNVFWKVNDITIGLGVHERMIIWTIDGSFQLFQDYLGRQVVQYNPLI